MLKNKIKRLLLIFVMIVFSIIYANTKNNYRNIGEAVQVTSTPVSEKVVILDAGHGSPDEGVSLLH